MFVISVCIYCVFFTETVVVTAVVGIFDTESRRVFKIFNKSVKKNVGACFDQTHASKKGRPKKIEKEVSEKDIQARE